MKYIFNSLLAIIFFTSSLSAQKAILSGYITDESTGEALIGANVYIANLDIGISTNEYGFYSIAIPPQKIDCTISYIGYTSYHQDIDIKKDTSINIKLAAQNQLEEIVVKADRVKSTAVSLSVPIKQIEQLPALGGEVDLLKSLSFFPGITLGQEGSSNLYVRGGTPDQNLILLDGIPVYNTTHLGGFLSVFNTNAINNVDIYKGDFPARYGGRLSSVIDVTMREGNKEKSEGSFGIGLLTSHLSLEGPLKKEGASYLFAARSSYLGIFTRLLSSANPNEFFDYWLFDINGKVNIPMKKGKLFFSVYTGNDVGITESIYRSLSNTTTTAISREKSNISWGNTTFSSRYVLPVRSNIFAKFLVGYSAYRYKFDYESLDERYITQDTIIEHVDYANQSKVRDVIFQANIDQSIGANHFLKYGIGATLHRFETRATDSLNVLSGPSYNSIDSYVYIEDDIRIGSKLSTNIGLRWSGFSVNQRFYNRFEPRLSVLYRPTENFRLKSSFSVSQQYIHLLSNNGFSFPNDIWVPANDNVAPQYAQQLAVGAELDFGEMFNVSVESYYKKMSQLIDYKDGLDDVYSQLNNWEELIEKEGKGEAYGIEFLLSKDKGRLTSFLSYTLSWNTRQFENISQGNPYTFTYNRKHDFSIALAYQLSQKISLSSSWVFQTGTAVTLPVGYMPRFSSGVVPIFNGRNNSRMPNYHRMDIGVDYRKKKRKNREAIWKLSIYNAYNRKNPSYLAVRHKAVFDDAGEYTHSIPELKQISLFSIIPAISYSLKF